MRRQQIEPDFYLASSEGYGLEIPRACHRIKRLAVTNRRDCLLISLEPPIVGQQYGLGDRDIACVVIAPRHAGSSLFPISTWPVFVHVARPLVADPELREVLDDGELEEIGWAEIYPTRRAAADKTI